MKDILAFGVIGAGYFGKNYIRILQDMPGVALRAVADRAFRADGENAQALPASVRRLTHADDLLSDQEIDCVVIATPATTHHALVLAALGAGKHVLVEKPMAMSMIEAEDIREAAKKSGRTLMVGHQYLYNDPIRYLKQKLDEKILGDIKYIFAEHFSFGPVRSDIGCFSEMAVHELSLLDYLFSPGEIQRAAGASVDFSASGREDFASVEVSFASGLTAAIAVSWFAPEKVRRMTIAGDRGAAVFDDRREEKLKFFLHQYPSAPGAADADATSHFFSFSKNEIIVPVIDAREPLRNQLDHFISCVRTGAEPVSGIAHGMRVMRMLDTFTRNISAF